MRAVVVTEKLVAAALRVPLKFGRTAGLLRPFAVRSNNAFRFEFTRKARSVILLCFGTLLCTSYLFAFWSVENYVGAEQPRISPDGFKSELNTPRKWRLLHSNNGQEYVSEDWSGQSKRGSEGGRETFEKAYHGLGIIFRRGSRAMDELIVAHVSHQILLEDFRLFLRTLHRSGATARADVLLLLPWSPIPSLISHVIRNEEENFQKLCTLYSWQSEKRHTKTGPLSSSTSSTSREVENLNTSINAFNAMAFVKAAAENKGRGKIAWGNNITSGNKGNRLAWGSIVGFEMAELDPDNVLTGFLDEPPEQLRRWVCYQMLLGMFRRRFRHVMITEVEGVAILGDALGEIRKRDCLYLTLEDQKWSDAAREGLRDRRRIPGREPLNIQEIAYSDDNSGGIEDDDLELQIESKSNEEEESRIRSGRGSTKITADSNFTHGQEVNTKKASGQQSIIESVYGKRFWRSMEMAERKRKVVSSGVIMGSLRPVKRLANAMVVEIVRVAIQRRSRHPFHDSPVLSYLVQKSFMLGRTVTNHLQKVGNEESVVHALIGSRQPEIFVRKDGERYAIVHGYGDGESRISGLIRADICSSEIDAAIYEDCTGGAQAARGIADQ